MDGPELRTERLWLRRWTDADFEPFAALNADPEVMEFFPSTLKRDESDALIDRIETQFVERGFGLFAVEVVDTGTFIGFVGLSWTDFATPFTPVAEVGWRLARSAWGQGYATEAASASIVDGFDRVGLDGIVSFTAAINQRSQRVMQRLGMTHDPAEDFDHPKLAYGHRLRRHALYRISKESSA